MYNFFKQNYIGVERGIQYMKYQRKVAILTDFDKKTAESFKNEEINRKKPKINLYIKKYVPILNLKRIFRLCKILCYQLPRFTSQ